MTMTCRYLKRAATGRRQNYAGEALEQCTAECVDPDAEMILCSRHLAAAARMAMEALAAFNPPAETGTTTTDGAPA